MTIQGVQISVDQFGISRNARDYKSFAKIADTLPEVGSGLTGGSHGTEQPYIDYRVNDTYVVRQVRPGVHVRGFLELIAWSKKDQELYEQWDRS